MQPIVTNWVAWSVCLSVCLCLLVCHTSDPCKNGWTNQDAVWVENSGGPSEPCIRWGSRSPWEGAIFWGKGRPIVKYSDTLITGFVLTIATRQLVMDGGWEVAVVGQQNTDIADTLQLRLAPPGECDWNARVQRRCGLMSNSFDHLFCNVSD